MPDLSPFSWSPTTEVVPNQLSPVSRAIVNGLLGPVLAAKNLTQAHMAEYQPGMFAQDMPQTMQELPGAAMGLFSLPSGAGGLGSSMRYPLYHGSPVAGLSEIAPSVRGPLGPGVYASPAEQIAKSYAGPAGQLYELPAANKDIYRGLGHKTDEEWFGFKADKQRLLDAAEPDKRAAVGEILDKMWSSDGYPAYQRLLHLYGGDAGAQQLFKNAGFHGISGLVDGPEVVLFGPQTLK